MANKILVFIEQRNKQIKKSSLEAIKAASEIASKQSYSLETIAIGNDIDNLDVVGGFGAAKVTHLKNSELENYSPSAYSYLLNEFIKENDFEIILFSNTSIGKDLAPRVAAKLDCGTATDCTAFNLLPEGLVVTRPIYGGKTLLDLKITSQRKVLTLRPNVFNAGINNGKRAEVVVNSVTNPDLSTKTVELKKSDGKIDVAEADIIVSGGRGMKGPENFNLIEELADALGAACGASRAVVDAGWRPHGEQVGQTGKTVSPTLYIALGISGAIQHLAGMRSSKYIVAINKDKDAPIFQVADYGIVGDLFEIVPSLISEIKKVKA
jgi:electron transfer flavoprotein alpha subunit